MISQVVDMRLRSAWRWCMNREHVGLVILFGVAGAIQLILAPYFALYGDEGVYVYWGNLTRQHFLNTYSIGAANPDLHLQPQYGPTAMYLFAVVDVIYFTLAPMVGLSVSTAVPGNAALTTAMKLPLILAHLGTVAVIYVLARRAARPRWALFIATMYAFSPPALIDVVLWGQTDTLIVLGVLLALLCTQERRGIWVGILFAVTIFLKPQPAVFIPVSIVYLYKWAGWREAARAIGALIGTSVLIWLPFVLPPRPEILVWVRTLGVLARERPYASDGALNIWWLLGSHRNPAQPYLGPLSPSVLGATLFLGFLGIALVGIWRDGSPRRLWFGAGLIAVAFFVVLTLQHERYYLPAVPILLIAALYDRKWWLFFGAVLIAASFNVILDDIILQPAAQIGTRLSSWTNGLISRFPLEYEVAALGTAAINLWLLPTMSLLHLRGRTTAGIIETGSPGVGSQGRAAQFSPAQPV
jgi:Glycosyltransferase family 87